VKSTLKRWASEKTQTPPKDPQWGQIDKISQIKGRGPPKEGPKRKTRMGPHQNFPQVPERKKLLKG